jgi:hypothetical protein
VARTLGRSLQELSSVRQDLLREGDIYSPQRGHVALAVPLFASFILAHYEHARDDAETNLLSLPAMHGNRGRPRRAECRRRQRHFPSAAQCARPRRPAARARPRQRLAATAAATLTRQSGRAS